MYVIAMYEKSREKNLVLLFLELKYDLLTMSPITAMTAMMAAYQWSVRNFFKEAMDLSDRRIFRRVARGPEGST
jgi:hypothetical protein